MPRLWPSRDDQLVRYAVSTFAKTLPWAAADAFGLYFLTDVAGVSAATAGFLVLGFFAWAALCDPLSGWLFDIYRRAGGSERRYFAVANLMAGFSLVAGFCQAPPSWAATPFLLVCGLTFRTSYAVMDVPHNALIGRLARETGNAVNLGGARSLAALLGGLVASLAAKPMLTAGPDHAPGRFLAYAATIAAVSFALFLGFLPKPLPSGASNPIASAPPHRAPARAAVAMIVFGLFLSGIVSGLLSKDIVYVAKYVLGAPEWTFTAFIMLTAGKLAAILLWTQLATRWGVVPALQAAFVLTAVTAAVVMLASPTRQVLETALVAFGLAFGGINMLSWALLPTLAPSGDGAGRFFGAYTATGKLAAGLSGLLLGTLLSQTSATGGSWTPSEATNLYRAIMAVTLIGSSAGLVCIVVGGKIIVAKARV